MLRDVQVIQASYSVVVASLDDIQVNKTVQEALQDPKWKKAVQDEIDAVKKNATWTITDQQKKKGQWNASGFSP